MLNRVIWESADGWGRVSISHESGGREVWVDGVNTSHGEVGRGWWLGGRVGEPPGRFRGNPAGRSAAHVFRKSNKNLLSN